MTLKAARIKDIAEIDARLEELRGAEIARLKAEFVEQAEKLGVSPDDILSGSKASKRAPAAPKYRNPFTGSTWSGRGKPPAWIAGVEAREPFLIVD